MKNHKYNNKSSTKKLQFIPWSIACIAWLEILVYPFKYCSWYPLHLSFSQILNQLETNSTGNSHVTISFSPEFTILSSVHINSNNYLYIVYMTYHWCLTKMYMKLNVIKRLTIHIKMILYSLYNKTTSSISDMQLQHR